MLEEIASAAIMLRSIVVASLIAPAHVFYASVHGPPRARFGAAAPLRRAEFALTMAMEAEDAYRTLGVTADAAYDEIMDRYMELSEKYESDPERCKVIDEAKDKALDEKLRMRMDGSLQATYEGMTAREDRPEIPKTSLLEHLNYGRKKLLGIPSKKEALRVVGLLGGLSFAAWVAPNTAGTSCLINVVSAMAFMYNRGEAEIPRDDFGQIGEIRPMKPKPMALAAAITAVFFFPGFFRAKAIVGAMASSPGVTVQYLKSMETVLRTTFCSLSLIIPALFVKVNPIFD